METEKANWSNQFEQNNTIQKLLVDVEDHRRQNSVIMADREALRSDYEALSRQNSVIMADREALRSDYEALSSDYKALKSDYEELSHKHANLNQKYDYQQNQILRLQNLVETLLKRNVQQ